MAGMACFMPRKTPLAFTFMRVSQATVLMVSGSNVPLIPALFTRTSSFPNPPTVVLTASRQSASLVTSSFTNRAWPPAPAIFSVTWRPSTSRTSPTTTFAPSRAKIVASLRPIPLAPPVMSATFPASLIPPPLPLIHDADRKDPRASAAARTRRQRRSRVNGISVTLTPSGASASTTALAMAAGAGSVPPSPAPLTPSGLSGGGVAARVGRLGHVHVGRRLEARIHPGGQRVAGTGPRRDGRHFAERERAARRSAHGDAAGLECQILGRGLQPVGGDGQSVAPDLRGGLGRRGARQHGNPAPERADTVRHPGGVAGHHRARAARRGRQPRSGPAWSRGTAPGSTSRRRRRPG